MCMSSMLWARASRAYMSCRMDDLRSIGLGDEPFYEELSLLLEAREIIPMIQEPEPAGTRRALSTTFGPGKTTRCSSSGSVPAPWFAPGRLDRSSKVA